MVNDNIKCYRFQRAPLGIVSSPFLLSATLTYYLEIHKSDITAEIRKNLYVDNVIVLTAGTQEAFHKYQELKRIFGEASMNRREFLSNDDEFNKRLPECNLCEIKKILGLTGIQRAIP